MQNREGVRSLMVNGKIDASARGEKDIATQIMLHKDPKNVFLVGYASGMTAGALLTHPIESLEAAEISPSIVEASKLFNHFNGNPLADPRLDLQVRDARQMLMTSDKMHDVIVSQPSNPWIKGQSSLFAYEWYNIVKDHLTDDGLLIQWLPAYNISERNLKIIINTLNKVFPNVSLWTSTTPGDVILMASKNPDFKASYALSQHRLNYPKVAAQIQKAELNPVTLLRDTFLMNDREVQAYLKEDEIKPLPMNTDDLLITEYTAPKNMLNRRLVKEFVKQSNLEGEEDSLRRIVPDIPD